MTSGAPVTATQTARGPAGAAPAGPIAGVAERDGVPLAWESYGGGATGHCAADADVVDRPVADLEGAGRPTSPAASASSPSTAGAAARSGRPAGAAAYTNEEYAADTVAVMDAAGHRPGRPGRRSPAAAAWSVHVAADHPDRVLGPLRDRPVVRLLLRGRPGPRPRAVGRAAAAAPSGGRSTTEHHWLERRLRRLPALLLRTDVPRAALDQAARGRRGVGSAGRPRRPSST